MEKHDLCDHPGSSGNFPGLLRLWNREERNALLLRGIGVEPVPSGVRLTIYPIRKQDRRGALSLFRDHPAPTATFDGSGNRSIPLRQIPQAGKNKQEQAGNYSPSKKGGGFTRRQAVCVALRVEEANDLLFGRTIRLVQLLENALDQGPRP